MLASQEQPWIDWIPAALVAQERSRVLGDDSVAGWASNLSVPTLGCQGDGSSEAGEVGSDADTVVQANSRYNGCPSESSDSSSESSESDCADGNSAVSSLADPDPQESLTES